MAEARRLPRIPVALWGFYAALGVVVGIYAGSKALLVFVLFASRVGIVVLILSACGKETLNAESHISVEHAGP